MKKKITLLWLIFSLTLFSQEETPSTATTVDVNYLYGVIANHNPNILHLITGHPEGVLLSWNRKTFGNKSWQERFNYPDVGVSLSYQNLKNNSLGNAYAVYGHYNFYFLKRNVVFRIGTGVAYATNPYDRKENTKNIAFGTQLLNSTYVQLNYKKEQLFKTPFGIQAGLGIMHYSNGNVKSPNTSINVFSVNLGLTYNLNPIDTYTYIHEEVNKKSFKEKLAYNIKLSGGINQGEVIGIKQYPFFNTSFYVDKRIGRFSGFQFGADVFFSMFLKEEIKYNSIAFPSRNIDPETDYKRVGLFLGHELYINKMSIIAQLGYYVYYPYPFEEKYYERLGIKRYFGKKYFASVAIKAHGAAAEAIEFGVGIRLK